MTMGIRRALVSATARQITRRDDPTPYSSTRTPCPGERAGRGGKKTPRPQADATLTNQRTKPDITGAEHQGGHAGRFLRRAEKHPAPGALSPGNAVPVIRFPEGGRVCGTVNGRRRELKVLRYR